MAKDFHGKHKPCKSCDKFVLNRSPNADYCEKCSRAIDIIRHKVNIIIFKMRKEFPDFKIVSRLKINKTTEENKKWQNQKKKK